MERLCIDCGKKPTPYGHRRCATCRHNLEKPKRRARWDAGERPVCIKHPGRTVARSAWICTGYRRCASCVTRYYDGTVKPAHNRQRQKYSASEQGHWMRKSTYLANKIKESRS